MAKTTRAGQKGTKRPGKKAGGSRKYHGPRLPNALVRELDARNPGKSRDEAGGEGDGAGSGGDDVYEYDDPAAEEDELQSSRRFDAVDNYEYETPDEFEDEELPSGESDNDDDDAAHGTDDDEEVRKRHFQMLETMTGVPKEAFNDGRDTEARLIEDQQDGGNLQISINDLLDDLHGKPGYSKLRKRFMQQGRKSMVLPAPVTKVERERLERKEVYDQSMKEISKWQDLVKRNREAPTLFFDEDTDLGFSTVGAIANDFTPRTEFEKKMAELVRDPEFVDAHKNDGVRLLELNKVSFEDVKDHQNRLAKMRALLFRHEMKSKRIKKIKSKAYHRLMKKDKLKANSAELEADPEAAKEYARKQELKRAEERMTLKHKNTSKWAKRIMKRGLDTQDEGTRAAVAAQLQQHALLTRKINSMGDDTSSSGESTDEDEDAEEATDMESALRLLNRAKEKTVKLLETENEIPKSGLFALPFMERSMKKLEEAANDEARQALDEYDASLKQREEMNGVENGKATRVSGKRTFGPVKGAAKDMNKRAKVERSEKASDSESEQITELSEDQPEQTEKAVHTQIGKVQLHNDKEATLNDTEAAPHSVFKSFDDISEDPGPKTTYEVAIFAKDTWKKVKPNQGNGKKGAPSNAKSPQTHVQDCEDLEQNHESESEEEMVEGYLSMPDAKCSKNELSQAEIMRRAFAGDDVEAEFDQDKMQVLNEEIPEPEKLTILPGWGQWTNIQKKKGPPSWVLEAHKNAKKAREEALKKRKDAKLRHVILSETVDKKVEKLFPNTPPFPYTSKEAYEWSISMPIGPDFNPSISVSALNRPAVMKRPGKIIKPIQYMEVDPQEKSDGPKKVLQKVIPIPKAKQAKHATKKQNGAKVTQNKSRARR